MKERNIIARGNVVHITQSDILDSNNTLVFLHGWRQSGKSFEKILLLLEKEGKSFVSIDLPGFGSTRIIDRNWHIEDYGKFVISVIEKLGLKSPILVGHSFGGRISIYMASSYKNIKKIVLIASAGIKKNVNPFCFAFIKAGNYIKKIPGTKGLISFIKQKIGSKDYQNARYMKQILINTVNNDLQKYMEKICIPSLLVRGAKDTETPITDAMIMHSKIQNSSLKVIPDATHFVFDEFPEETTQYILGFIYE